MNLIRLIDRLLPQSKEWLIKRGYVSREGDALQVTPAGYEYFIRIIGSNHGKGAVSTEDQQILLAARENLKGKQ